VQSNHEAQVSVTTNKDRFWGFSSTTTAKEQRTGLTPISKSISVNQPSKGWLKLVNFPLAFGIAKGWLMANNF
jgi:hypothetical protein